MQLTLKNLVFLFSLVFHISAYSLNMEARVYLVRHGETIANKQEILVRTALLFINDDFSLQCLTYFFACAYLARTLRLPTHRGGRATST